MVNYSNRDPPNVSSNPGTARDYLRISVCILEKQKRVESFKAYTGSVGLELYPLEPPLTSDWRIEEFE